MACLLTACTSVGRKIDTAAIDKIEKGKTTRDEVIKLIGSPDNLMPSQDGGVAFTYMHMKVKPKATTFIPVVGAFAGGADMKSEHLMIAFGPDGVVKDVVSTYVTQESGSKAASK
jgi:outer membrane protein assembly factor BamE (lipoprotein component of BamABCDE complex)